MKMMKLATLIRKTREMAKTSPYTGIRFNKIQFYKKLKKKKKKKIYKQNNTHCLFVLSPWISDRSFYNFCKTFFTWLDS